MGRKKRDAVSNLERSAHKTDETEQQASRKEVIKELSEIGKNLNQNSSNKIIKNPTLFNGEQVLTEGAALDVDLSMDISSSVIGIALLEHRTGALVKLDHIKLNISKLETLFEKAEYADLWLRDNIKNVRVRRIFVEQNMMLFGGGSTTAQTLFTLAKINALISYLAHKRFSAPIFDVNVTSARAKIGIKFDRKDKTKTTKEKVRENILLLYPDLPIKTHLAKTGKSKGQIVPDKESEDEIDAFVIGMGARIIYASN